MSLGRVPRVRRTPLPDDAVLVVRGDTLDPDRILKEARRFLRRFPDWGRYGISAFCARTEPEVDVLCQVKLIRFPTIVVLRRQDLAVAGVEVVGTFRTPHVTLAHADVEELVRRLLDCEHTERANPYHVVEQPGKDRP